MIGLCLRGDRHPCPDHVNPAEFFADLISIDYSSSENEELTQLRLQHLVQAFKEHKLDININEGYNVIAKPQKLVKEGALTRRSQWFKQNKVGWWKQFQLLLKRAWLQVLPSRLILYSSFLSCENIFTQKCLLLHTDY